MESIKQETLSSQSGMEDTLCTDFKFTVWQTPTAACKAAHLREKALKVSNLLSIAPLKDQHHILKAKGG